MFRSLRMEKHRKPRLPVLNYVVSPYIDTGTPYLNGIPSFEELMAFSYLHFANSYFFQRPTYMLARPLEKSFTLSQSHLIRPMSPIPQLSSLHLGFSQLIIKPRTTFFSQMGCSKSWCFQKSTKRAFFAMVHCHSIACLN